MFSSKRYSIDFEIPKRMKVMRFPLKIEITKVSPIAKALIIDYLVIEELRCFLFFHANKSMAKVEHPTGKLLKRIDLPQFNSMTTKIERYQEMILIYDLENYSIYDLCLTRLIFGGSFSSGKLMIKGKEIRMLPNIFLNSGCGLLINHCLDVYIYDFKKSKELWKSCDFCVLSFKIFSLFLLKFGID